MKFKLKKSLKDVRLGWCLNFMFSWRPTNITIANEVFAHNAIRL